MKAIRVHTELPTTAEAVWQAMQHAASFLYVNRGVFGFPALAGRTAPVREGEKVTGWLTLFHLIPLWRHTIHVVEVDQATRTLRSHEQGGILRAWNHTLHVEPVGRQHCRYSDTVDIDAGPWTGLVAIAAVWIYRYRQRRWHRLVRNPCYRPDPATPPPAGTRPATARHC